MNILIKGAMDTTARTESSSQIQQGLYILHCIDPGSATYNVSSSFQLKGPLNLDALSRSVKCLLERHESLRSAFRLDGTELLQIIFSEEEICKRVDATGGCVNVLRIAPSLSERERDELLNQEIDRPFDLHQAPLFRCTVFSDGSDQNHSLVITVHHSVFDHHSKSILLRELGELYTQYLTNKHPDQAPPKSQFSDYLQLRQDKLETSNPERALQYWRKKLAAVESLELPLDNPRPNLPSGEGVRLERELPAELVSSIRDFASSQQVTFFIATLTLAKVLLALWTGKKDIAVGTHIADRTHAATKDTIGLLLNTLVLRTSLAEEDTFADLLKSVQKTCFNAFRYADTPFETLVNELQPTRNYQNNPFFDVRFSHLTSSPSSLALDGLKVEPIELVNCRARYDLTLTIRESGERCFIQTEYRTSLFERSTIEWLLDKYVALAETCLHDPSTRLDTYPLIDGDMQYQLLHQYNETKSDYPAQKSVFDLIIEQCQHTPQGIALRCDGECMTYSELLKASGQLATHMQKQGVVRDALVAINLERSIDMVVAALAVLRVGATYLPVDYGYPVSRIEHMIRDSGCEFVISHSWLDKVLPKTDLATVCLDTERELIGSLSADPQAVDIQPDTLAYIIYTSGSTGTPKGVQVTHRNVVNFLCSMREQPGITSHDKLVAVTTLSFDIAVLELWLPLISGATCIIATGTQSSDGSQLRQLINDTQATVMQATPVTWRLLIKAGWKGAAHFKSLCGGEALPADLAADLVQRCGEVWNMYGPTETTVWSSIYKIKTPPDSILIGKPIANTTMYILDWRQQPAFPGVVGELFIGGDGVTAGYLGKKELTSERYVHASFLDGQRIYATGDAARYTADGNIECLGRLDNQIKVRGHRIELGEIETRLNQHPAVRQSIATTVSLSAVDIRIVAGVELHTAEDIDNAQWREWLRQLLPDYMVPQMIVPLAELPLTPNGKLDRNGLAAMDLLSDLPAQNPAPPQTRLEKAFARMWAELLGASTVPVNQTFFDLGGHSLLAMQLIARAREELSLAIDPLAMTSEGIRELLAEHDSEKGLIEASPNLQTSRSLETFFFCDDDLYGRLHRPISEQNVRGAVLLCNPVFAEASNILWAYQRLATILSEQGYYVLRFDYFGCGNSMGEDEEGDARRWQQDVDAAAKKLLDLSGHIRLSVLGFRYGATLAASLDLACVDKFVLWEPVVSSSEHIALFDKRYHGMLRYLNVLHKAPVTSSANEITGFSTTPLMVESVQALDLVGLPLIKKASTVFWVTNKSDAKGQHTFDAVKKSANRFVAHVINDSVPQIQDHDDAGIWLPGKSLNTLVECLIGGYSRA